jgi:hypothetical protein
LPNNHNNKSGREQRIFLRIPTKLSAQVFVDGRPYKKVSLEDLSSSGLSFYISETAALPHSFKMRLRLPGHLKSIKIELEAMNRKSINGVPRIGCRFVGLSKRDEHIISKYVLRFMEFSLPCRVLGMAAFLLFIDALCRLFAYLTNLYYIEINPIKSYTGDYLYGIILIGYAIASFIACISSDNIRKKRFLLGFFCAAGAFLFILLKNITYLELRLWQADHLFITTFLQIQSFLLIYTGFAIVLYAYSIKTINFIANSIESYRKTF